MKKDIKTRLLLIIEKLKEHYTSARIQLKYSDPFQLLVSVILSAQCTDKKVNEVTEALFKRLKGPDDFIKIPQEKLEKYIRPTGFFRNKAKNIKKSALMIARDFDYKVPDNMDDLLKLPGVARKTANIILGNAYNIVEGIAVDTHVKRLSKRLGLSKENDPDKIEKDLMTIVPKDIWFKFTYLLIEHGRNVCDAKKPGCDLCFLKDFCPSYIILINQGGNHGKR